METAITTVRASTSITMNDSLSGMRQSLQNAAQQNLDAFLAEVGDEDYTAMERRAMLVGEQLKLVSGLDLGAIYFRGELIKQIREEALHTVHPERFQTAEQMAATMGISATELSYIESFYNIIFPWMESHGLNVATVWEEVGKAKFKEMNPVLKALITGEMPGRGSTLNAVETLLGDVAATAAASGEEMDDEEIREQAAVNLIEAGGQMTVREMQRHLRPEQTESITFSTLSRGGRRIIMAEVNEDQFTMFQNKMRNYSDLVNIWLPEEPRRRASEAARYPLIREIANLLITEEQLFEEETF